MKLDSELGPVGLSVDSVPLSYRRNHVTFVGDLLILNAKHRICLPVADGDGWSFRSS